MNVSLPASLATVFPAPATLRTRNIATVALLRTVSLDRSKIGERMSLRLNNAVVVCINSPPSCHSLTTGLHPRLPSNQANCSGAMQKRSSVFPVSNNFSTPYFPAWLSRSITPNFLTTRRTCRRTAMRLFKTHSGSSGTLSILKPRNQDSSSSTNHSNNSKNSSPRHLPFRRNLLSPTVKHSREQPSTMDRRVPS